MADKINAELFGILFEVLAQIPDEGNKALAKKFFEFIRDYDFSYSQMRADEALITLGLAKREIDPDFPEEGEMILYFSENDDIPFW